ncbi:MAG: hypothetical protein HY331_01350 [Chloroflexi bacterium]|nr:hypothetical protein [Chloroflexota bacterium]
MPRQSTTAVSGWGGRRAGAGRKRATDVPLHSRELRLTLAQIAFLNRYGRGNLSAGARQLIDEAIARQRTTAAVPVAEHEPP